MDRYAGDKGTGVSGADPAVGPTRDSLRSGRTAAALPRENV